MTYENIYEGATYSLEPKYGNIMESYITSASHIGLATDPRTANQLREVSNKINPGGEVVEVSTVMTRVLEAIPDQHLEEIRRLSKLTGTEITMHGPAVEPSGYTTEGGLSWSEASRQQAEAQILSAVERSHKLDAKGNIPVTFHPEYVLPEAEEKVKMKIEGKWKEMPKSVLYVDARTGAVGQIKETEKYFPEYYEGKPVKEFKPEAEIKKRNQETWDRTLNEVNFYASKGEEYVESALSHLGGGSPEKTEAVLKAYALENKEDVLKELQEKGFKIEKETLEAGFKGLDHASLFLRDSYNNLRELYNRVYKDASGKDKEKLESYANEMKKYVETGIERNPGKLKQFADLIEKGVKVLGSIESPTLFQPLNNFLIDKTSDTFSNVALEAYKKFGEKSPIISIENPPAGTALSRGEELKKVIEESRRKFVQRAKQQGMPESKAKEAAEKLIGATWDVGHINMLRKYGYDKADIIKETEKIAPFIKHVHLSDNFGFEHTELPMGMGNVPFKEMMKKLGKKGEEIKKIVEAADWYQHFQTSPLVETYEASASPLYPMKAPYWNQIAATYGNYFSGYGTMLPEQHFALYGAGFSNLPAELGGQIPGRQSRFAGTPNA